MISSQTTKVVTAYVFGTPRNILLGAGLGYAIETEKYYDVPLVVFFPSVYAGYQVYKNKNQIVNWLKDTRVRLKHRFF